MTSRIVCLLMLAVLLTALVAACGTPAATATPAPANTPVATLQPSPTAAATLAPSQTPTPGPTATPSAVPATPTPGPTAIPAPTPAPGQPVSVTLTPSKDNTLYEDSSGGVSNGQGQHLFVGQTASGQIRRAVIAFDVSSVVPAGATILSAELRLRMSRTTGGGLGVSLHRLTADWGEGASTAGGEEGGGGSAANGDATWVHRLHPDQTWSTQGGDFVETASADLNVAGTGQYVWQSTTQTVADVQAWLDTPDQNFGWLLKSAESGNRTAKRFDSRQNSVEANRPQLVVQYVMP